MKRTPEVLDCWFESGSMPMLRCTILSRIRNALSQFPADLLPKVWIRPEDGLHLTVLASALFNKPAFKNVIVNGIILAEDGKKLSKRLKNYAPPEEILNKLGADALRLFLINSPAVKADDLRFSEKGVMEISRAVLLPFWNAYSFFVTYANVDNWIPKDCQPPQNGTELDNWIISLLNNTIASINTEMEQYNLYKVVPLLVDYIDNLTNWYIRRSRRRFWKSENDQDKMVAYSTLYFVLVEFSKVMSPFLPFLTEAIYRNLVVGKLPDAPQSVHLNPYPKSVEGRTDLALERKMRLIRQAVTMGRALRSRFTIKTRQPLKEFVIIVRDDETLSLLRQMEAMIKDELNVKEVRFDTEEEVVVSISAKANFKRLGKIYGPKMKEAASQIEALSVKQIRELQNGANIEIAGRQIGFEDIEIRRCKLEGIEVETEGELTVALDTTVTEELLQEGMAREFINRVQNIRKNSGLNVTDRIVIRCNCPEALSKALSRFRDYVCAETLAVDLLCDGYEGYDPTLGEQIEIDELKASVVVEKTDVLGQ